MDKSCNYRNKIVINKQIYSNLKNFIKLKKLEGLNIKLKING